MTWLDPTGRRTELAIHSSPHQRLLARGPDWADQASRALHHLSRRIALGKVTGRDLPSRRASCLDAVRAAATPASGPGRGR
jgi:hypothetical protein